MPEHQDKFVPETTFVIRHDGRWYVQYRQCTAAELPAVLATEGFGHSEVRVLREWRVNLHFLGEYTSDVALRLGWVRHWKADNWYPMEEPMPWLPGQPQPASVAFVLTSILHGAIAFYVGTTSQTISCYIDDIYDSLILFVRFAQLIRDGGCPQAVLVSDPSTFFVVQAMPGEPGHVRLVVGQRNDNIDQRVDVHLDRSALLDALRTFLTCIAHDQALGHMFLCFCEMDSRFDLIDEQIEAEWRTVCRGRRPRRPRCRVPISRQPARGPLSPFVRPSTSTLIERCCAHWKSRPAGLLHRIGFCKPVAVSVSLAGGPSCQADCMLPTTAGMQRIASIESVRL
jgi:hypothetical protein